MNIKLLSLSVLISSIATLSAEWQPFPRSPVALTHETVQQDSPSGHAKEKSATKSPSAKRGKEKSKGSGASEKADPKQSRTYSSLDRPDSREDREMFPPGLLRFTEADLFQVLDIYQEISGRTIVRSSSLPAAKITVRSQTSLSRRESLQVLDTVLAENGITMIPLGTKFMKVVSAAQASTESVPVIELPPDQLPESSSYMMYIVQLKGPRPRDVAPAVQPFAKMPNSIIAMDSANILVLRDYSSNIRRMLQVVEKLEKNYKAPAVREERR